MNEQSDHGPRLSNEEYDERIVDLHSGLPSLPTKEQAREVRRRELDLAIDHRLGRDFPRDRRDALWTVQRRVDKKQRRLMLKHLVRKLFAKSLARDAQGLAGYLVDEYAKVLSRTELESFFGAEEARRPALPIDLDQLRK